ncbi:MAG: gamma carbonic anhydrase family protein [Myxococcales bacterium]|nr:gamma carbonic anhydrase family protein [Myxococcales bacterium]
MIQRYEDKTPVIDPTAWVHPTAVVIGDVVLGPHVSVWPGAVLRGDCGAIRIGAHSNLQDGCIVHITQGYSETHVGERVTVGHGAILHGCRIADDCLIGMNATVLDNAAIGDHSIVAAGSVVTVGKSFPPGVLLVGNPAKVLRPCTPDNLMQIDLGWQAYLAYMEPFRDGRVVTIG